MPSFATTDAALDLMLLLAIFTGIEALKWMRLRRHAGSQWHIKVAFGGIIAGIIFTVLFAALVAFGVVIGQPAFELPNFASFGDWLYVVLLLTPLVLAGLLFAAELRSLRDRSS